MSCKDIRRAEHTVVVGRFSRNRICANIEGTRRRRWTGWCVILGSGRGQVDEDNNRPVNKCPHVPSVSSLLAVVAYNIRIGIIMGTWDRRLIWQITDHHHR